MATFFLRLTISQPVVIRSLWSRCAVLQPRTNLVSRNQIPLICEQNRYGSSSFFTRLDAQAIWKSVTSVSKAGKRRGRGKGTNKKRVKDLNRGQILGVGRVNMSWPGLNAPILKGQEVVTQKKLGKNTEYFDNLLKIRNEMEIRRKTRLHPLERGWAGVSMVGKWIGPPAPVGDETFEGFDSKVIMQRPIFCMKPTSGRSRSVIAMVVTGNKKGCAGFSICEAKDYHIAVKKSLNQAAQRLRFVERDPDGDTIIHDFVSQYGAVKIFAYKKPEGYGIVAHRVLKAICQVLGIRNIYCKTEGPTNNYRHVVKAFFLGLCELKSFQQIADEKKLHIVELREDDGYYPRVVASPSDGRVRTHNEIGPEESTDVRLYLLDGKIVEYKPTKYPDYVRTEGFVKSLMEYQHVQRNRQSSRVYLKARYGRLDSFLTFREREDRNRRKQLLALAADPNVQEPE